MKVMNHDFMEVIQHDIVPDGDLELVLHQHSTQEVVPSVDIRYTVCYHKEVFDDYEYRQVVSRLDPLKVSDSDPLEVRFRVSSRHLTLVSPVFKKMIEGPWKESSPREAKSDPTLPDTTGTLNTSTILTASDSSVREITTTGWDAHALSVVLNIIHGRQKDVPREIDLEFFASVAAIVNYYDCAEAVQLAAELWFQALYEAPDRYGYAPIMWLFISKARDWNSLILKISLSVHYSDRMARNSPPLTLKGAPFTGHSIQSVITSANHVRVPELWDADPVWLTRIPHKCPDPIDLSQVVNRVFGSLEKVSVADFEI
ncbi:hypothetical protein FGRMN_951 [Fusarium graminum]|nr:hypothetical protein FGRMN_951 [Fusarium graminum]